MKNYRTLIIFYFIIFFVFLVGFSNVFYGSSILSPEEKLRLINELLVAVNQWVYTPLGLEPFPLNNDQLNYIISNCNTSKDISNVFGGFVKESLEQYLIYRNAKSVVVPLLLLFSLVLIYCCLSKTIS